MNAKIYCFASAKGGAGKTTIAATIGAFLASLNKKVLLVDTDAATNGLTLLYLKEVNVHGETILSEGRKPRGIYETGPLNVEGVDIVELKNGTHLAPASYGFFNTESVPVDRYKKALASLTKIQRDLYDFIILDAQAGSDEYAYIAMTKSISDEVVIVSEYDPMSAAGVERLKALFRNDLTYNRTWVLLNKMLPEFVKSFSDFLEVAKYLSPLPWDADVVRAYARRSLALDMEKGNTYTLAVTQLVSTLCGDSIKKEIEAWKENKTASLKQPITIQREESEKELIALEEEIQRIKRKRIRNKLLLVWIASVFVITGISFASTIFKDDLSKILSTTDAHSFIVMLVLILTVAMGTATVLSNTFIGKYITGNVGDEIRIKRRTAMLEDRISKLENLEQANVDTLISLRSKGMDASYELYRTRRVDGVDRI